MEKMGPDKTKAFQEFPEHHRWMVSNNRAGERCRTSNSLFFYLQQSALTPEPVAMTTVGFCGNSGKYFNQQGLSHFLSRTVLPLFAIRESAAGSATEPLKHVNTLQTPTHRYINVCVRDKHNSSTSSYIPIPSIK